jgi:hypothetical protein
VICWERSHVVWHVGLAYTPLRAYMVFSFILLCIFWPWYNEGRPLSQGRKEVSLMDSGGAFGARPGWISPFFIHCHVTALSAVKILAPQSSEGLSSQTQ